MKFGVPMIVELRNWATLTQEPEAPGFESAWLPEHPIIPVEMHTGSADIRVTGLSDLR
jgi:alkanesulfonate monooxygenase SsuD/methylene tetrahydromethanopterin reductase-like flavin-dependent oxidoreductase (luciferase family)